MLTSMAYSSHLSQEPLFAPRNKVRGTTPNIEGMKSQSAKQVLIQNIRSLLAKNDWSNRELSRKSGVSDRMIGKILTGESIPTTEIVEKIANAFSLEHWQLMLPGFHAETANRYALNIIVTASMASKEALKVMESQAEYLKKTNQNSNKQ